MDEIINSINSSFSTIEMNNDSIRNVSGGVDLELKMNGWFLNEFENEECVTIKLNDKSEIKEGYLLKKEKVLEAMILDEIESRFDMIDNENGF